MDLSSLNDNQKLAVTTIDGPVMVMAGAGSGKTRVLTMRIAHLINDCHVLKDNILAVTFTNKAANEMKERIAKLIDDETDRMWVSTFHSFCSRILRYEIYRLDGYTRFFTILDDEDSNKIVKDLMKEKSIDENPKRFRDWISRKKNYGSLPKLSPATLDAFDYVFDAYELHLKDNNLLDFDDLLLKTIELFELYANVLEYYQDKFEYILVDEFQDTNEVQYKLLKMLASKNKNIFVVGDDFQSIYSFRGAKIENIQKFLNEYKTKLILLEKNYRSTTEILDIANEVIKHNPNQIEKNLTSNNKTGKKPIYKCFETHKVEKGFIIDEIKKLLLDGYKYSDIAIIYRANYVSRGYEDLLLKYQIPYKIYGNISFYSRAEIKDMIAYLKLIVNHNDDFAFERIVNVPRRKIGPTTISRLTDIKNIQNTSLFDAIDVFDNDNLNKFKKLILELSEELNNLNNLPDIIDIICEKTGYFEELKRLNDEEVAIDKINNVKEFKSYIARYKYDGENYIDSLELLLYDLSLLNENDDKLDGEDAVTLSTYHQVKGLEFSVVFLVALEETIFPSINVVTDKDIEEERRVFYVGITRAKDRLFMTSAKTRFLFGKEMDMIESRFVKEIDKGFYNTLVKKSEKKKKLVNESKSKTDSKFSPGDIIQHDKFGFGVVIKSDGENAKVAFKQEFGIKDLNLNHPSIKIIKKKN